MSRWCAIFHVIPLTIPSHQERRRDQEREREGERERLSRVQTQRVDAQRSAAFRCAINNRDVSSHSSAVTRSTFWRDTAASCRVTRITAVTLRAPSISLSLSSLIPALSLSLSFSLYTDRPTTIVPCPRTSSNLVSLIIGRRTRGTLVVKPHRGTRTRDAEITRRGICNWHGFQGGTGVDWSEQSSTDAYSTFP